MLHNIQNNFLNVWISENGAEVQSIKHDKREYLWQGDSRYWGRRAPILFPIVGSLKNKKTIIANKEYRMNQHGFLRDQIFSVVNQTKSSITFFASYNHNTLQSYPFQYEVYITHILRGAVLKTSVEIKNLSKENMMFNIGGHPGYNVPLYDNESFESYKIVFEKPETFASPSVTKEATLDFDVPYMQFDNLKELELKYSYFDIDAIIIPKVHSKKVKLINQKKQGIEFSFPDFTSFAIWTPPKAQAPFVCLEPWNGYADKSNSDYHFTKKDNLIYLKSNESKSFSYSMKVLN